MRIPKHKGTEETRGFAYVEFTSTISHRVCKLFIKVIPPQSLRELYIGVYELVCLLVFPCPMIIHERVDGSK